MYLCWHRAFWNEVGRGKRCVSLTLTSVADAQFVAVVGSLLIVALPFFEDPLSILC